MTETQHIQYERIAAAIAYISQNFRNQPRLEEIAEKVHLSPYHFQRLFTEWAGTSPKKFLQYISISHAKKVLKEKQATLSDAAHETGLSGTGRLHDLFVNIEGMTPAEYKNGGKSLEIHYSFAQSPFGPLLIATTSKGICHMAFAENRDEALAVLVKHFPNAKFMEGRHPVQQDVLGVFNGNWSSLHRIKLHLKGTPFQLKVWEALLRVPMGQLSTYGDIAIDIKHPKASRAVGTAIGSNPVAFLIPCHRVIQSTGALGGYMWGTIRKTALIGWEAAKTEKQKS
ncbi:methylated-DNA--[protein]-cysteine S-methyltransferase [Negadavirga shengliensis]|uniref:Methylated-DNA--[protein]-cysteine S-methyltransferase n=1 Tax=Negadavirga shengliensis TaxID=1389218 RepID=A0ABV9T4A6_9BACT